MVSSLVALGPMGRTTFLAGSIPAAEALRSVLPLGPWNGTRVLVPEAGGSPGLLAQGTARAPETTGSLGPLAYSTGLYNLARGSGTEALNLDPGGRFVTEVNLTHIVPRTTGVVGYPCVRVGYDPFAGGPASTPLAGGLSLPAPAASLGQLWANSSTEIRTPAQGAAVADLAYDLWLTRTAHPHGAGPGDLEVMVWLGYTSPAILPGRTGDPPRNPAELPVAEGSSWHMLPFLGGTYRGSGGWTLVILVPPSGSALGPENSVDLSAALAWARTATGGPAGPLSGPLWLEAVELGTEFLASGPDASSSYTWELAGLSLAVET